MKVLFISSWYPNSVNPLKGLFVKKHAEAIRKAGIDIQVLALTVNPSKKIFEKKARTETGEEGMITHHIELNSLFYKLIHLDLFWQYSILKSYYKKNIRPVFTPDLVHSNVLYPGGIMGHWLAKKEKKPHVITEHWSKVDKFMSRSLYANLGTRAYHQASAVTVVSGFLKKRLSRYVGPASKTEVVPNVISTSVFNYRPKQVRAGRIEFCCVAQWRSPKRPDLLFDALDYIAKQMSEKIILNVVGEGPLLGELKTRKLDFEVNYCGVLDEKALAEVLWRSDYFLHASDMETFSIVTAEALATGTPVLVSNTGALSELVNSSNGLIADNTTEDWAKNIFILFEKKFDHARIAKEAQRFDGLEIGRQFKSVYRMCGLTDHADVTG